jgi:hypothetical protein
MQSRHNVRRALIMIGVLMAAITFLGLVVLSPFALRALSISFGLNWSSLSNIGQTYGAVSALITALALGGVVISLLYQARDVSAARSQAIRTTQFELLRLELEDADLMWASGAPWGAPVPADYEALRRHIFVHMWLSFWESQFVLREMSATSARLATRELFSAQPARDYWHYVGKSRLAANEGRVLQFLHIVDEEYQNTLEVAPTIVTGIASKQQRECRRNKSTCYRQGIDVGAFLSHAGAAATGLLAAHLMCHRSGR